MDVPDSITLDVARYGLVMALANVITIALEACAVNATQRAGAVPVLEQLAQQDSRGRFVRMSGEELAAAIGTMGGANAITAAIQTLRRNISIRVAEKTAKRDLAELVAQQQIELVRQGRDGFHRAT